MDEWIVVPSWDTFQHYSNRNPVWIKVYLELRDRDEWRHLTDAQRGLLLRIWLDYAASGGLLSVQKVRQTYPQKTRRESLDSLARAGFIHILASKPLAQRREENKKKELGAITPKKKRAADPSVQRANVLPKDPVQAIKTMIQNGVITDLVDLEAELAGAKLNSELAGAKLNSSIAAELRGLLH